MENKMNKKYRYLYQYSLGNYIRSVLVKSFFIYLLRHGQEGSESLGLTIPGVLTRHRVVAKPLLQR